VTKKYCFDTSGISNPLQRMPDDIFPSLWKKVVTIIESGRVAITTEIYDEMVNIRGMVGDCIIRNKQLMVLEVADNAWNWPTYIECVQKLTQTHKMFISEFTGGAKSTVGLNDISIIALAKALNLPVVSEESPATNSLKKRRIPDVCRLEQVEHLTFIEFLRRENIRFE